MPRPSTRSVIAVLLLAVAVVAGTAVPATARPEAAPTRDPRAVDRPAPQAVVAHATAGSVGIYEHRDDPEPGRVLSNPTATDGALVFLVERLEDDGWLRVLLPVRPNGSTGWIRASDVALALNPFRIVVRLGAHRLTVKNGREVVLRAPIGVGTEQTPTPGGRYYVTQLFQPPDPTGPYGPFAYALSGFSEVLTSFRGGEAIIGIHGTNRPDLLGRDVSHGCIRMANDAITELAALLPLGTPVEIRRD